MSMKTNSEAEATRAPAAAPALLPSFSEALRVWLKIGLLSFGGPAGQIALLHREIVDERRWISDTRFLHALNFCTLLPGPEAQQLATYLGWLLHGVRGGVAAGTLFVLPGQPGARGCLPGMSPGRRDSSCDGRRRKTGSAASGVTSSTRIPCGLGNAGAVEA
ncbi:chromate transporter [Falsiroseomonas sp. E2-1-a20]|uniref:chromate transporter n=1 Tax=Falsiroseomonas sp. E2-1-a20 TaxID=3239300 RepID=UPI003F5A145D